jgi:C-terminal processing protease CtpA/Prc
LANRFKKLKGGKMPFLLRLFVLSLISVTLLQGCSSKKSTDKSKLSISGLSSDGLRDISVSEREQDFNQLVGLFKSFYGPYKYKENLLGISIDQVAAQYKAEALAAKNDEEFAGVVMKFGASLRDGHVQIVIPNTSSKVSRYVIPIVVDSIEGRAIVVDVTKTVTEFAGINIGDEITAVDGQTPQAILAEVLKYRRSGTAASDNFFMFSLFSRPSYMTSLTPKKSISVIDVKRLDGSASKVEIPWELRKYNGEIDKVVNVDQPRIPGLDLTVPHVGEYNSIVDSNVNKFGAVEPFFWNDRIRRALKFVKVTASEATRAKYGLKPEENPPIFAGLYNYKGKNILFARIATYSPSDFRGAVYLKAYQALFEDYQDLADVLVLDQTHNPGGSYCSDFYELFGKSGDAQAVQQLRADRKWINELTIEWPNMLQALRPLEARQSIAFGLETEKAYDRGDLLSPPVALFNSNGFSTVQENTYKWTKPMLVLADHMAGSCGDMFPMLVKFNKRAKILGAQTMGLGGNVEEVGVLSNSRISIRMTRGLFHPFRADGKYLPEDYIENNGVMPDYPYTQTVLDFRLGYPNFVKTFSDRAIEQ